MPTRVTRRAALLLALTCTAAAPLDPPAPFRGATATHGAASRVLAEPGTPAGLDLPDLARRADTAATRVDRTLATRVRPLVLVPATDAGAARLIGAAPEALAGLAALADQGRVIIVPGGYTRLTETGRDVVLTHELTHVAAGTGRVPPWLREGFADYVAYRDSGLSVEAAAAELLADIRAGRLPYRLPEGFGPPRQAQAYQEAWLACRLIAAEYGEARLVRLYRDAAQGKLDLTPFGDFTARWRAHLKHLGRGDDGAGA
ncbi:hypothetical protein [Nonomuraea sp. NPDC050310]|uniref:hypothetical protein n=1 Tax=Nonomuraea sp. NPDC050310 TaxID=3154935 RepID=UPI0033E917EA